MVQDGIASNDQSRLPHIQCPVSSIMARIKHISVRKRTEPSGKVVKEYIVQVNGKTHNGRHATLKAAKQTLRKVLQCRVLPMVAPKKKKKERQVSHTVGASFHQGNQRWVGNQVALGKSFATEALCRAALKAHARKQLKRKHPATSINFSEQGEEKDDATSSSTAPSLIMQRVHKIMQWGERGRTCSGKAGFKKKNFPADLWCSLAHCEKSRAMYKKLPVTRLLSLQSKFGHAKDALLKAWIRKFSFNLVWVQGPFQVGQPTRHSKQERGRERESRSERERERDIEGQRVRG